MKTILACLDFSEATQAVVRTASALAMDLHARLVLLHAVPIEPPVVVEVGLAMQPPQDLRPDLRIARTQLNKIAERVEAEGINIETVAREGRPAPAILAAARRLGPGIIVLGSHGHGAMYHLVLGSVTQEVIRGADRPVLVVPRASGKGKRKSSRRGAASGGSKNNAQ